MSRTGGARDKGATAPGASPAPVPELRWRQIFPGEERQLRELRRWLAGLLPDCAARDDVVTVAVELATNAVRHTRSGRGGWFAVEVTWHRRAVRVAVADQGAPSGPRLIDDPMAEHGRGLQVVRGLSARTGVAGGERGRLLWAEVPWIGAPSPAAFGDGYEDAIREGQNLLAHRHAGVPAWFGHATLQWWALAGRPGADRLVAADTPQELAWLLDTLSAMFAPPRRAEAADKDPAAARAGSRATRHKAPVPPRRYVRPLAARTRFHPC